MADLVQSDSELDLEADNALEEISSNNKIF